MKLVHQRRSDDPAMAGGLRLLLFSAGRGQRQRRAGFTMVEIAIALGVIAFALVAIIGILPTGLQVQRNNRAETIINQDATFWLDAIKSGSRGMDELVTLVDRIDIHYNFDDPPRATLSTYTGFRYGWEVIGLLTTPARTNAEVYASVWAVSGSAAEKEPNVADRAVSFKYRMRINIEPGPGNSRSFTDTTLNPGGPAVFPLSSLYDIRLTLAYPLVREDGSPLRDQTPTRAETYRTAASRRVIVEDVGSTTYTYFAP
jgi:type II secretory pathway pseudopilin PulG